jgi:HPt (histidine-containing phosphotransfer) domain-containing protein
MHTRIVIVGRGASQLRPVECPVTWEPWDVRWVEPDAVGVELANPKAVAFVGIDLTGEDFGPEVAAILSATERFPRLVFVSDGASAIDGIPAEDMCVVPPPPCAAIFDRLERSRVDERVAWLERIGGAKFVREMTELVSTEIPKAVGEIGTAAAAGDSGQATRTAHRLRSSASNIGARSVSAIAAIVEAGPPAKDLPGLAAEMRQAWDRIAGRIEFHRRRVEA